MTIDIYKPFPWENPSYLIDLGNGKPPIDVPMPEVLPSEWDELVFVLKFQTLSGTQYVEGDRLILIERTQEAPNGRLSSLGNWIAMSKAGITVWSNIEWMLATGMVVPLVVPENTA